MLSENCTHFPPGFWLKWVWFHSHGSVLLVVLTSLSQQAAKGACGLAAGGFAAHFHPPNFSPRALLLNESQFSYTTMFKLQLVALKLKSDTITSVIGRKSSISEPFVLLNTSTNLWKCLNTFFILSFVLDLFWATRSDITWALSVCYLCLFMSVHCWNREHLEAGMFSLVLLWGNVTSNTTMMKL